MRPKHPSIAASLLLLAVSYSCAAADGLDIYVNPTRGNDRGKGTRGAPLKTVAAAILRIPKVIRKDVSIHLAEGRYETTGRTGRNAKRLELNRPMSEGVRVRIVGSAAGFNKPARAGSVILNWEPGSSEFLITVTQGHWTLENIQVATRRPNQRRGISVCGPGLLELRDVRIHTGSQTAPGLYAHHAGRIHLYGTIELNEDLHEKGAEGDTFCRLEAEHSGSIAFKQRKGASLSIGNGTLDARRYGIIQLGCAEARITSWTQSNPIAVNNSGRVDLDRTTTYLCARSPRNTPIGLEHDGHVMAEGARIIILGCNNNDAIILQKVSSFFCNDVQIKGKVKRVLMAYSGSTLLAGIIGDLGAVRATTGSTIIVEKCTGKLIGPFKADKMGQISLPDGKTIAAVSDATPKPVTFDGTNLPPLHLAAYGGHQVKAARLIDEGADVNRKGPAGMTPLHLAAMQGHRGVCELLLSKGANLSARTGGGVTPAEIAENHGHNTLAKFLRQKASDK